MQKLVLARLQSQESDLGSSFCFITLNALPFPFSWQNTRGKEEDRAAGRLHLREQRCSVCIQLWDCGQQQLEKQPNAALHLTSLGGGPGRGSVASGIRQHFFLLSLSLWCFLILKELFIRSYCDEWSEKISGVQRTNHTLQMLNDEAGWESGVELHVSGFCYAESMDLCGLTVPSVVHDLSETFFGVHCNFF